MTTTHNNATNWRDLADQLTPQQIAEFTRHEEAYSGEQNYLLMEARSCAEQNLDDQLVFGGLETPTGSVRVYIAQQHEDGTWYREFAGTSRNVAGVTIHLDGIQFADGSAARQFSVVVDDLADGPSGELSAAGAREFAAKLVEAADELERLK